MSEPDDIVSRADFVKMVNTIDRPPDTYSEGKYTRSGTRLKGGAAILEEGIPRFVAYAEAGVGRAGAEFSIFEAQAKGPNVSAGAEAGLVGVNAIVRAEVGSVSASAGPIKAKLGLGVDTGLSLGVDGLELKVLGTGVTVGSTTTSVSLLGSEVSCVVQ